MGSSQSVSRKVNFEDIQYLLNKNNEYILINTLDKKEQDCLIKNTILIQDEEKIINHFMKNNIDNPPNISNCRVALLDIKLYCS